MAKRHPVTVTLPTDNQILEAREWLADCFEDMPDPLTTGEVVRAINRHYDGGWSTFLANTVTLVLT
jgi:hypothetical protein